MCLDRLQLAGVLRFLTHKLHRSAADDGEDHDLSRQPDFLSKRVRKATLGARGFVPLALDQRWKGSTAREIRPHCWTRKKKKHNFIYERVLCLNEENPSQTR